MKKILLTILSLFLLTGCFSFREKSNSRPAITIDTDYLSGDASYLYYYQSLSSKEKEIYENIYNCILDNAKKVTISSNDYELVQKINDYVLYDHPGIYYLDYFELQNQVDICNYIPSYSYSKSERDTLTAQLESVRDELVNSISSESSDYDKLKKIYQFVIEKCRYVDNAKDNQYITSSLIYGETVCSGYVKAIQYLAEAVGIKSAYIVGKEIGASDDEAYHAWNLIYLDDDYYYLDATWGDYDSEGNIFAMMNYFMFDSDDMLKLYEPLDQYEITKQGNYTYFKYENLYNENYNKAALNKMVKQYKHDNIAWMEFKFSDSCYQEAKKRLIDQEEMFDLFNPYTSKQYTVQYFYYDNLNVLIFNQKIE
ncbi:transglutaminase domain-containing protein [Thomasclavelia ramosa]|uniref:transglutaminase domain-containing protein n=1 Tax=Thomasclavelia ramosa TaxID=1547 RepID=UPI0022E5300D|nr:transglutaminase domain-containing protein [Thomasclavelia ramosa]